jgi:hypothetical protein
LERSQHINLNTLADPTLSNDNSFCMQQSKTAETPIDLATCALTPSPADSETSRNNNDNISTLDRAMRDPQIKFMDDSFD